MKEIIIKSQSDWDAVSSQTFDRSTIIRIYTDVRMVIAGSSQAHLVTRESSQAHLNGTSLVDVSVYAQGLIHIRNESVTATLFGLAVAYAYVAAKITKKDNTSIIIKVPTPEWTVAGWLDRDAVEIENKTVTLFKRVSNDLKTQEGTKNETVWVIGTELEHPSWNPKDSECGEGKFHACSRAYFCDQFRDKSGDRYVAIQVKVNDIHAWKDRPYYPHKIAFRKGKVLNECSRFGKEIKA